MLTDDARHMRRALALARAQTGRTGKNPAVGCAIISKLGHRLSEGATIDGGSVHAEEIALKALGGRAPGATIFVTLEPCRERSAGGASCSQLLIDAGIARVVCAIEDAHPNGAGGLQTLRQAGIRVETGLLSDEAATLYEDFFSAVASR